MKVYEVECGAVIRLAAQDMQQATLQVAAVIKDNPHLIYVRAVHERNLEAAREDSLTPRAETAWQQLKSCPTAQPQATIGEAEYQDRSDSSDCGKSTEIRSMEHYASTSAPLIAYPVN